MAYKRLIIIGSSGSGKTTLARRLEGVMGLPVHHLDKIYWGPDFKKIPRDIFDEKLLQLLESETWILDGNYNRTLSTRLSYCDTVLYLDYNRMTSILGVLKRVGRHYGKTRPDMGDQCSERLDIKLLHRVWNFNKTYRLKYYDLIDSHDVNVLVLRHRKDTEKLIERYCLTGRLG